MKNTIKVHLHLDSNKRKSDGKSKFSLRVAIGRDKKLYPVFPKKSEQPFMEGKFWVNETCSETGKKLRSKRIKHTKANPDSRKLERGLLGQIEAMQILIDKLEAEERLITHEVLKIHWQQDHQQCLSEWISEWLGRYAIERNLKPSSVASYSKFVRDMENFENSGFRTTAGAVSVEWLQKFQQWQVRELDRAPRSAHNAMVLIGVILRYAKSKGALARNVYQDFVDNKLLIKVEQKRGTYLTEAEIEKLYEAYVNEKLLRLPAFQKKDGTPSLRARTYHGRLGIVLFACYSGLRISDLHRVATNHPSLKIEEDSFSVKMKKTGKNITIPISERMRTVANMTGVGPVFSATFVEKSHMNTNLREILGMVGIDKYLSFHGLRRSFASCMLNSDVPLKVVSELLGHSNTEVTERRYAFLNDKRLKEAVSVFDKGRSIVFENPEVREFVEDVYQLLQSNPGLLLPKRMQDRISQLKAQLGLDVLDMVQERRGVFRAV